MKPKFYMSTKCRFCQSTEMELVLPLAPSPLCDEYLAEKKNQEVFPLDLYFCRECNLSQIKCVIDPSYIYKNYVLDWRGSLPKHFKDYANDLVAKLGNNKVFAALDIGSSDGSLLKCLKDKGLSVLGIEPADEIANIAKRNGVDTIVDYFNKETAELVNDKYGQFDIVTINNLFANIDNVDEFVESIKIVLSKNGVIVIESAYLGNMIENIMFDFVYHEHLSCISILPLELFFQKHDMKLVELQPVSTKGGSMRYYFARNTSSLEKNESVNFYRNIEIDNKLNTIETFYELNKKIVEKRNELLSFLLDNSEKKVVGYGASATSTTFLYHFGVGGYFDALVDENAGKIGTYSPGLHLKVFSPEYIYNDEVDAIVIIAWRYAHLIIEKLKDFKGEIIVPLPEFRIIKNN